MPRLTVRATPDLVSFHLDGQIWPMSPDIADQIATVLLARAAEARTLKAEAERPA